MTKALTIRLSDSNYDMVKVISDSSGIPINRIVNDSLSQLGGHTTNLVADKIFINEGTVNNYYTTPPHLGSSLL